MRRLSVFLLFSIFILTLASCSNKNTEPIANYYTITFNTDGGSSIDSQSIKENDKVVRPINPIRNGYDFANWYFDDEEYDFDLPVNSDLSLYAKWNIKTYQITYDLNGGNINLKNPTEYTVETEDITLKEPYKEGYVFYGWYFQDERITTISKGSTGDMSLIAKWNPKIYEIEYNLNGGINNPDNPISYTVLSDTIVLLEPTKEGFTFDGWYVNPMFVGNRVCEIKSGSYGDKALFAKWVED